MRVRFQKNCDNASVNQKNLAVTITRKTILAAI